jgi:hypothetical protein
MFSGSLVNPVLGISLIMGYKINSYAFKGEKKMSRSAIYVFNVSFVFIKFFSLFYNHFLELLSIPSCRLLALATCFATKMIRRYGLLQHREDAYILQGFSRTHILSLPPVRPEKVEKDQGNSRRLSEMAHFLEVVRNLQYQLSSKFKRPGQGSVRCFVILLL